MVEYGRADEVGAEVVVVREEKQRVEEGNPWGSHWIVAPTPDEWTWDARRGMRGECERRRRSREILTTTW